MIFQITKQKIGLAFVLILICTSSMFAQPVNDDPCQAIPIIASSQCISQNYSNVGATNTTIVPPPSCNYYGGGDVWFVTIVPSSGNLVLNFAPGTLSFFHSAVYTATDCNNSFTEIACDANGVGVLPQFNFTGLTPGDLLFIRVWDSYFGPIFPGGLPLNPVEFGTFQLCVVDELVNVGGSSSFYNCSNSPIASNECSSAQFICSFDSLCGSTIGYSSNSWTQLTNNFCGTIENNSFYEFTANSPNLSLNVNVSSPGSGFPCAGGIQLMVFTSSNCGSGQVTPVHCESALFMGTNTVNIANLVPGNNYYLMLDGNGGDLCDYNIGSINGSVSPLYIGEDRYACLGTSTTITATGQNGSVVNWQGPFLNQSTGSSVQFTPTSLGTYTIIADSPGIISGCGLASDTITIEVIEASDIQLSYVCDASTNMVTVTPSGGSSYLWNSNPSLSSSSSVGGTMTFPAPPTGPSIIEVYGQSNALCIDYEQIVIDCSLSLPIEMLGFNGEAQDKGILLNWITLSEQNSSHFELEKSSDLSASFIHLANISAKGHSSSKTSYDYIDMRPNNGLNYYKLIGYDMDGTISSNEIIAVDWGAERVSIFPNPVVDVLKILLPFSGMKEIRVASSDGKLVYSELTSKKTVDIDTRDFTNGVYYLNVKTNDEVTTKKLLIVGN